MPELKRKITQINKLLLKKYGLPPRPAVPPDPVDLLIATILSQNTNDKNSYRAFKNLKEKHPSWNQIAELSLKAIEKLIKPAGLGKQKSVAIKSFLTGMLKEKGSISLKYLKDMDNDSVLIDLTSRKGIGIKTASCVLLFSMRRNVCPVDTHVHRTTNRLGIVSTNSPDKTFAAINSGMPENTAHSFHTNLIRLGREICKPAKPLCAVCPLLKICGYKDKNLDGKTGHKENNFMLLDSIK